VRNFDGTVERRFSREEILAPAHLVVSRSSAVDAAVDEAVRDLLLFPADSRAVFLGRAHYGSPCTVVGLSTRSAALAAAGRPPPPSELAYRVRLEAAPAGAQNLSATAKQTLANLQPQTLRLGEMARKLGVGHRVLAALTGSFWVRATDDRFAGRVDLGLCVKNGRTGACVPDFCRPDTKFLDEQGNPRGWVYTPALLRVLEAYRSAHPWVFAAAAAQAAERDAAGGDAGPPRAPDCRELFPDLSPDDAARRVEEAGRWLRDQVTGKRPLVPSKDGCAWDFAVRQLQAALPPPRAAAESFVELDEVAPALLLPPLDVHSPLTALVGGPTSVGDRVVSLAAGGQPPFGLRGTVVGSHAGFSELLFDAPFTGGTTLHGRCEGNQGLLLSNKLLINLSRPRALVAPRGRAPVPVGGGRGHGQGAPAPAPPSLPTPPPPAKKEFQNIGEAIDAMRAKIAGKGNGQMPAPPPPPPGAAPPASAALLAMLGVGVGAPPPPPPPPPPPRGEPSPPPLLLGGPRPPPPRGAPEPLPAPRDGTVLPGVLHPTAPTPRAAPKKEEPSKERPIAPWAGAHAAQVATARVVTAATQAELAGPSDAALADDAERIALMTDAGGEGTGSGGISIEAMFAQMQAKHRGAGEERRAAARRARAEQAARAPPPSPPPAPLPAPGPTVVSKPAAEVKADEDAFWALLQAKGKR